jgi:NADH-quinone oxidoreductase subunit A
MNFFVFIVVFLFSLLIAASMIILSYIFGPKKKTEIKLENFECGMPQADLPKKAVKTNFYLIAVLFVIFDIEIIYLYPWSLYLKEFSKIAFLSGFLFISILILTLIYLFRRGALKWD